MGLSTLSALALSNSLTAPKIATSPNAPNLAGPSQDEKLRKATDRFESMLVSTLWKDMVKTFADPGSGSDEPGFDTMRDLSLRAMTTALASSGGIGISRMLYQQIERLQKAADQTNAESRDSGKSGRLSSHEGRPTAESFLDSLRQPGITNFPTLEVIQKSEDRSLRSKLKIF
jgi:Rod binding domain-containing protein